MRLAVGGFDVVDGGELVLGGSDVVEEPSCGGGAISRLMIATGCPARRASRRSRYAMRVFADSVGR